MKQQILDDVARALDKDSMNIYDVMHVICLSELC